MATTAIIWLRQDLRLTDNPALHEAVENNSQVIPLYIFDKKHGGKWSMGGAYKWWLNHSITELQNQCDLVLREGDSYDELIKLVKEAKVDAVYWNRRYEPYSIHSDAEIKKQLEQQGVKVYTFNGSLLFEPWEIQNLSKQCYKVFTSFWKMCVKTGVNRLPLPMAIPKYTIKIKSLSLSSLKLLPSKPNWAKEFGKYCMPGEKNAKKLLNEFLDEKINHYADGRNFPAKRVGSDLSPYLRFGEISPLQIWHEVQSKKLHEKNLNEKDVNMFLSEIGWREFSYHILYHFPHLHEKNLRENYDNFPWSFSKNHFNAWTKGLTGYPIVDAGMRQLWLTGAMHNRVRMIVASFLIKHLLIDWRKGEEWFWDTLVDADLAANAGNWQWVAGSGVDAAPYYRIFNPTLQGERFDQDGEYVKTWVPELKNLPKKYIHSPWLAPKEILKTAQINLGENYPLPIVEHVAARDRALAAYKKI